MNIRIEFFLNGEPVLRDCDAADSLMDILRKDLGQKYLRGRMPPWSLRGMHGAHG
jgi:aerobic-type carbon monoxide dehydrogenase small subunit (CoxS/CutS family)